MIKQNKGEWSELYVFLKLLGDGVLCAADSDLNIIEDLCYPLVKILRKENSSNKEYHYNLPIVRVLDSSTEDCLLELSVDEFKHKAIVLLNAIKSSDKTFAVPEIEDFMEKILCTKVKADSTDKSDINIVLHDNKTYRDVNFGFSIKSRLGSASTLLNAGDTTNFIYEIYGTLSDDEITYINNISTTSKIKDRINSILSKDCKLCFKKIGSPNFYSNLQIIDSALPEIMSEMLVLFYSGQGTKINELTSKITLINPCKFDLTHNKCFYEYKVKSLLSDAALGMTPASPWNGRVDATGGYIVVKEDGDIVCYHLYNRNEFQDYLFKNTKFETPSSSRYNFGQIYKENDKIFIKLNLQVRFI